MSVPKQNTIVWLDRNVSETYQFNFQFKSTSDIKVYAADSKDKQLWKILQFNVHYTLTPVASDTGGVVKILNGAAIEALLAPLEYAYISIERDYGYLQEIVLGQSYLDASNQAALDLLALQTQQLADRIQRIEEIEGIFFPQGQVLPPNEVNRLLMIALQGRNKNRGANIIQTLDTGDLELRDGDLALKDLLGKILKAVEMLEAPTVRGTVKIESPLADVNTVKSNTINNSGTATTDKAVANVISLMEGTRATNLTAKAGGANVEFHLVTAGNDTYVVLAKVVGTKATLEVIKDSEHSIKPINPYIKDALLKAGEAPNKAESILNVKDFVDRIKFYANKMITWNDTNDASLVMNTVNNRPYVLRWKLDPLVNLNPSNAEQEFVPTRNGVNIDVTIRQNTKWGGGVFMKHFPLVTDESRKLFTTSALFQDYDGVEEYIGIERDLYLSFLKANGQTKLAISANANSAYKRIDFNFGSTIVEGASLYIDSVNGDKLGTKTTPYYWDKVNNSLVLPIGASITFESSEGKTVFRVGGDSGFLNIRSYGLPLANEGLVYDVTTGSFLNRDLPIGGGGSGGEPGLKPGTPFIEGHVPVVETDGTIQSIPVRHSSMRQPGIPELVGSLDFINPGAAIYFNTGTIQAEILAKIGHARGSYLHVVFDTSFFNDQENLYYDAMSGTIKTRPDAGGGTGGGNGNALYPYYMVAGIDGVPISGDMSYDGYDNTITKPLRIKEDEKIIFQQGEGANSALTTFGTIPRGRIKKEVLMDFIPAALPVGASSYVSIRRETEDKLVLMIADPRLSDIKILEPFPTVGSALAVWVGHSQANEKAGEIKAVLPISQSGSTSRGGTFVHRTAKSISCVQETVIPVAGKVTLNIEDFNEHSIQIVSNITDWDETPLPEGRRVIDLIFITAAAITKYPSYWYTNAPLPKGGIADRQVTLLLDTKDGITYVSICGSRRGTTTLGIRVFPPYPPTTSVAAVWLNAKGNAIGANLNAPMEGDRAIRRYNQVTKKAISSFIEYLAVDTGSISVNWYDFNTHVINVTENLSMWFASKYLPGTKHVIIFIFEVTATVTFPSNWQTNMNIETAHARGTELSVLVTSPNYSTWYVQLLSKTYDRPVLNLTVVRPFPTSGSALAVWASATGNVIRGVLPISQEGNVRKNVIYAEKTIKAVSTIHEVVTINAGVLTLNVVSGGAMSFQFTHDQDVTSFIIQTDIALAGRRFFIELKRLPGGFSGFPRLSGYYTNVPGDGVVPFGNDITEMTFEFMESGEKYVYYTFIRNT